MNNYVEIIKKRLNSKRYLHSIGVAETAKELALINGVNPDKAYLAGLIHDYAKCLTDQELLNLAKNNNLIADDVEYKQPDLLHGPVGAFLLKRDHNILDESILRAVRYHTTGCADMDTLTKIIYIADYIEPNRVFNGVKEIRELAFRNLSIGVLNGLDNSLKFIIEKNKLIHPLSIAARNWIIENIRV
ncbi:putative HD superfamily hydrolase of NAD metabolism [Desulfonispora thiosulfatigenes DSM 11270]|uniref:bis(5'-nucleosyl)-tetraphosphatase (symmetrical) n=1 Tax=Desulfonispora thiosulfatigenes DSM 11270 TaxID=656914 RepID=A0A1W1UHK0_DESTI|nr:bis(5'-nucleosyl)-tetraphosphatase (symmetrical) YqeK [Desulfonispora thiosulfatigenes]SMB80291.1 putative HD superfamily hydrolase of NAD metabolism [Desulfonispora thiosulfatigenes DSM 11270]